MRKLAPEPIANSFAPRRSWREYALLAILVLICSPVLYEAALLCWANWHAMWGQVQSVETPVLDSFGTVLAAVARPVQMSVKGAFLNMPWKPTLVIGLGISWALVGIKLLRR